MPTYKLFAQANGYYSVEGDLTFFSINKKISFDFLKSADEICLDLKKVNLADSAGLALIVEWIKHSKHYGTKLTFKNIPEQLLTLAKLSGFENNENFADFN